MKHARLIPPGCEPFSVSREEGADMWGVGTTKWDELVADGIVPRPMKIGTRTVWDLGSLKRAWKRFADENGAPDECNPWERLRKNGYQAEAAEIRPKAGGRSA